MSPDVDRRAVGKGAKGIVIAGVGNGNMNKASVEAAAECRQERRGGGAELARADGNRRAERRAQRRRAGLHRIGRAEPAEGAILLSLALLKLERPRIRFRRCLIRTENHVVVSCESEF